MEVVSKWKLITFHIYLCSVVLTYDCQCSSDNKADAGDEVYQRVCVSYNGLPTLDLDSLDLDFRFELDLAFNNVKPKDRYFVLD